MTVRRVLITGAAGAIGSVLRQGLAGHYELLRLSDKKTLSAAGPGEELNQADISDFNAIYEAMSGVEAVVHLGAIATEDSFESLISPNFLAVYNIYEAAYRRGVERVVFASSNHAIGLYPVGKRIGPEVMQKPDSFYGVGKAFGENMGILYHTKWGLDVACLRIGSFLEAPSTPRHLSTWLSHGDMVRLVRACLDTPTLGYAVVYGISANTRGWWDNPEADRIGFVPQDNAEDFAQDVLANAPPPDPDNPADRLQGGPIAAIDFGRRPRADT